LRVLVTGAGGLLGTDLCRRLAGSTQLIRWTREVVDVTDAPRVLSELRRAGPEVVIHTAAMTDVDACERDPSAAFQVNAEGARIVAEGCAAVGAFLIAVSTDYAFDGLEGRAYREEDRPRPVSVYARSKVAGEEAALKACARTLVVRVSGLFGGARSNFVRAAAERLRDGQEVPVVTDQTNSPSYTRDLAEGFWKLTRVPERNTGILHLANSGGASRLEVAEEIARILGKPASLLRRTTWAALNRTAKRPANSALDCSRFSVITGAALRPWREAVRSFLQEEVLR